MTLYTFASNISCRYIIYNMQKYINSNRFKTNVLFILRRSIATLDFQLRINCIIKISTNLIVCVNWQFYLNV